MPEINNKRLDAASLYYRYFENEKWRGAIQYLSFPSNWQVQIIPPKNCSVISFRVKIEGMRSSLTISLEAYDGYGNNRPDPLWIIATNHEVLHRVTMSDTEQLIDNIRAQLQRRMDYERNERQGEDIYHG